MHRQRGVGGRGRLVGRWSRWLDRHRPTPAARESHSGPGPRRLASGEISRQPGTRDDRGGPIMSTLQVEHSRVVSEAEWLAARKDLLGKEKSFSRQRDALSAARRELPWVRVDKQYVFDAPGGKETLADLFEGRSQLIVYHFMFGPDWEERCPSCSRISDHFHGPVRHLAPPDAT